MTHPQPTLLSRTVLRRAATMAVFLNTLAGLLAAVVAGASAGTDTAGDWLVSTDPGASSVSHDAVRNTITLTNGLVTRTFTTAPAFGTVDFVRHAEAYRGGDQSLFRSVHPEVRVVLRHRDSVLRAGAGALQCACAVQRQAAGCGTTVHCDGQGCCVRAALPSAAAAAECAARSPTHARRRGSCPTAMAAALFPLPGLTQRGACRRSGPPPPLPLQLPCTIALARAGVGGAERRLVRRGWSDPAGETKVHTNTTTRSGHHLSHLTPAAM